MILNSVTVKLNRCNLIPINYTTRKMSIYSDGPKNRRYRKDIPTDKSLLDIPKNN